MTCDNVLGKVFESQGNRLCMQGVPKQTAFRTAEYCKSWPFFMLILLLKFFPCLHCNYERCSLLIECQKIFFTSLLDLKAHNESIISTYLLQQTQRMYFNSNNALKSVRMTSFLLNHFFPFMHNVNNTCMKQLNYHKAVTI